MWLKMHVHTPIPISLVLVMQAKRQTSILNPEFMPTDVLLIMRMLMTSRAESRDQGRC